MPFLRCLVLLVLASLLSGCVSNVLELDDKAIRPIPMALQTEMSKRGMTPSGPILIRIFKQESELEVWKQDRSGAYALLKTYPMCRWSGKLGPKTREGDRQAPEGFYHVRTGMLNPNSQYYLSFNLGYPNRLEEALGYTGDALMVHGACTSAGCFALTDEGVAEIYATARDALRDGQSSFQVQAFPFRMTARNMAKHRNDPNLPFWNDLKRGYDLFEATRRPPSVGYCGGRYVFGVELSGNDPLAPCPAEADRTPQVIAERLANERREIEAFVRGGGLTEHAYSDGGMHPSFRRLLERQGDKALSRRVSTASVPISRPAAALADPHSPQE